jgi:hypothetical protein
VQVAASSAPMLSGSRPLVDVVRDHIQFVLETVKWRIE